MAEAKKNIAVVIDGDGHEQMYVDGLHWPIDGDTVYACDIAEAAGCDLIQFSHVHTAAGIDKWPKKFKNVRIR